MTCWNVVIRWRRANRNPARGQHVTDVARSVKVPPMSLTWDTTMRVKDFDRLQVGDLVRYRYWAYGKVGKVVEIDRPHSVIVESDRVRYRFYRACRMHVRRIIQSLAPLTQ